MGCASSAPTTGSQGSSYPKQTYNTNTARPVANVHPQKQRQDMQRDLGTSVMELKQKQHEQEEKQKQQEQQQQQAEQQQQQQQQEQQPTEQPSVAPVPSEDQTKTEDTSPEVTMAMVQRYIELEKQVHDFETRNIMKSYHMKKEQLADITKTLQVLEDDYKKACEKVKKEKADVDEMQQPNVRAIFKNQEDLDAKMSKEQEEYLEAVTEQEVVKTQLDGIQAQKDSLTKEVESLTEEVEKLKQLYDEQDELLVVIFSGAYGSDLENQLEAEVDQLLERKERISLAKYKWTNCKALLEHACNQLAFGTRRWMDVSHVPPNNLQQKYQLATETRNNLIAASQNITSAHRYLNNITFPYCEPSEIETLDRACTNIYVDMQSHERHQHAYQCFSVTHRRAAALLQWFESVITKTITKDLEKAKKDYDTKKSHLQRERLRLIKAKMGEELGEDFQLSEKDFETKDDDLEPELVCISQPEQATGADDLPKGSGDEQTRSLSTGEETGSPPTPLPLNELAPPPSNDELFGNIEQLKKQHEQELQEFEKAQETNKARMEQGLQEKLRARRSRRRRMEIQESQAVA